MIDSTNDNDQNDESCSREKIIELIGGRSIGQIVGYADNIRPGEPDIDIEAVIEIAIDICNQKSIKSIEYFVSGSNINLVGRILSDGNHRFVASRLMNYPIDLIPSPSKFGIIEESEELEWYVNLDWDTLEWRNK